MATPLLHNYIFYISITKKLANARKFGIELYLIKAKLKYIKIIPIRKKIIVFFLF